MAVKTKTELEQELKEKDNALLTMQKQMEEMQKMVAQLAKQQPVVTTLVSEEDKLSADEDISVVNLCEGELNISTEGFGKGTVYTFNYKGEELPIPLIDLKAIVRNNKSFAQGGAFYILDERAVKECKLATHYKKMLSDEQMLSLFDNSADKVIELYKLAPKTQQDIIVDAVVNKRYNKEKVDANILLELGKLCGRDLMGIEPLDE